MRTQLSQYFGYKFCFKLSIIKKKTLKCKIFEQNCYPKIERDRKYLSNNFESLVLSPKQKLLIFRQLNCQLSEVSTPVFYDLF